MPTDKEGLVEESLKLGADWDAARGKDGWERFVHCFPLLSIAFHCITLHYMYAV